MEQCYDHLRRASQGVSVMFTSHTAAITQQVLTIGHIIQIVAHENPIWIASLFIVDEVKSWGCLAYCPSPGKGNIWVRFKWEEFVIVGEAVMLMDRGNSEEEE